MIPVQQFAGGVLAELIRRQPASPARTTFAWELAVGQNLARMASVDLQAGVLTVRARDPRWAREIERASATILERMQSLLGRGAVNALQIIGPGGRESGGSEEPTARAASSLEPEHGRRPPTPPRPRRA